MFNLNKKYGGTLMIFIKIDNYESIWIFSIICHHTHLLTYQKDVFLMKCSLKSLQKPRVSVWWEQDGGLSLKIDIYHIFVSLLVRILRVPLCFLFKLSKKIAFHIVNIIYFLSNSFKYWYIRENQKLRVFYRKHKGK